MHDTRLKTGLLLEDEILHDGLQIESTFLSWCVKHISAL